MAEESVKVAVRVRPFNQREKDANSTLVIDMAGNQTLIKKPKSNDEPRKFAFDFSYYSHDGFKTESNGYFSPANDKYADQKKVFSDLGVGIMKNAWEGYNASIFAYGQTGSGKSYSIVGYGVNKGIVPMFCEEIFNKMAKDKVEGTTYEVTFSMLEIYSEQVRDLLSKNADKKTPLTIREDPKIGFYPTGLNKQLVASYVDIAKLTDEGTANRTIASTNMNATSSRAHTIITINFVQKYKNPAGKEMSKSSMINLVDLAGSERADQTGATGDRLKEGAAINLSLTSLGNVISALAENSSGKNVRVPYRDSVLTKLLMNALGGNSKTIMVAAVSPADINYDESLSTLRYADRAKQIKCKALVNEDPTEKLIKSLQEENAKLKELLKSGGKLDASTAGGLSSGDDVKKALADNEKEMLTMKQSYEEKLAQAQAEVNDLGASKIKEKAKKICHFRNINMDPALSGKNIIILEGDGKKTIGKPGKANIELSGLGIEENHAAVTVKGNVITLEKIGTSRVMLNGKPLTAPAVLNHCDRLVFGSSQYFVFVDPSKKKEVENYATFEAINDEIAQSAGLINTDKTLSQGELKCQGELVDLIPKIDEANAMSIEMDKKVKFEVMVTSSDLRGEYTGAHQPMILVKNFGSGYEWVWTKKKFLDRREFMSAYYTDFKDNGVINSDKFKEFDPFQESPDTPTQIGTAIIFAKSFAYMAANKGDYRITNMKNKLAGTVNIEISPCNAEGKVLTDADGIVIRNPEKDLLNKKIHFLVKINNLADVDKNFEDIFCKFGIFNDAEVIKTEIVKKQNDKQSDKIDFKFSKQFDFVVTPEFLSNLLNKSLYIQVWGEQVHRKPDPALSKLNTKEFFDKEKHLNGDMNAVINGVESRKLDPEKQRMRDDLKLLESKNKQLEMQLDYVQKLNNTAKSTNKHLIPQPLLEAIMQSHPDVAEKIIKSYADAKEDININTHTQHLTAQKSHMCSLM